MRVFYDKWLHLLRSGYAEEGEPVPEYNPYGVTKIEPRQSQGSVVGDDPVFVVVGMKLPAQLLEVEGDPVRLK